MADLLTAMRAHLLALPGITALVGSRVYPETLPQRREGELSGYLPALVLLEVDEPITDAEGACGDNGVSQSRVQVDCYAEIGLQARDLDRAVRTALHGQRGTWSTVRILSSFRVGRRGNPAPEIGLSRISSDYLIIFDGGV